MPHRAVVRRVLGSSQKFFELARTAGAVTAGPAVADFEVMGTELRLCSRIEHPGDEEFRLQIDCRASWGPDGCAVTLHRDWFKPVEEHHVERNAGVGDARNRCRV